MSKSRRSSSTKRQTAAATVLVNDTRRRVRQEAKDLQTSEIEFRLSLARQKAEDIDKLVKESVVELTELKKAGVDTQHMIAELEQLLLQRSC